MPTNLLGRLHWVKLNNNEIDVFDLIIIKLKFLINEIRLVLIDDDDFYVRFKEQKYGSFAKNILAAVHKKKYVHIDLKSVFFKGIL